MGKSNLTFTIILISIGLIGLILFVTLRGTSRSSGEILIIDTDSDDYTDNHTDDYIGDNWNTNDKSEYISGAQAGGVTQNNAECMFLYISQRLTPYEYEAGLKASAKQYSIPGSLDNTEETLRYNFVSVTEEAIRICQQKTVQLTPYYNYYYPYSYYPIRRSYGRWGRGRRFRGGRRFRDGRGRGGGVHGNRVHGDGGGRRSEIEGGGVQKTERSEIEGGGVQKTERSEIERGGVQRSEIEGGGVQRSEIEGGGVQRNEIEGGGVQRSEIEGGGVQRSEIEGGIR
jgi:uncharacterized protein (DUF2164 family)